MTSKFIRRVVTGLGLVSLLFSGVAFSAENKNRTDTRQETDANSAGSPKETIKQGIRVSLDVSPLQSTGETRTEVKEGEYATVTLSMSDAATAAPVTATQPRVWIDLQKKLKGGKKWQPLISCSDKIRGYLQGTLSFRPDIDLNSYFILTLNNDATISVIDPIRGVAGYSQLYAMIPLTRPGEDWVYSRDGKQLYVTMPKAGQIAVIDTESFKLIKNISAGSSPSRIVLQPDDKYLWVGNNGNGAASGVTVLDAASGRQAAWLPTGAGHHEIAFSSDSRHAFVSNRDSGTVSIIDIQQLRKIKDLETGSHPVSMAFSNLSKNLYVAHEGDGSVVVIDGLKPVVTRRIPLEPGLKSLRLAPGERWGFVVNSRTRQLSVFDVSSNSIAYSGEVGNEPEQVSFTNEFAYIRSKKTAEVTMITLANLGKGDKMTPLRISGGGIAPSESTIQPSLADNIVGTPEGNAVLIASPADETIVYYMEGMGVPAGNFRTYGRVPRAVSIVNRQLRETAPGVYSANIKVPASGRYDLVFLLDSPRVVHCFEFEAATNPIISRLKDNRPVEIELLDREFKPEPGSTSRLKFRVKELDSGRILPGIKDVTGLITSSPSGSWRQSYIATPLPDGTYEISFNLTRKGIYKLYLSIPSLQVRVNQLLPIDLHLR